MITSHVTDGRRELNLGIFHSTRWNGNVPAVWGGVEWGLSRVHEHQGLSRVNNYVLAVKGHSVMRDAPGHGVICL